MNGSLEEARAMADEVAHLARANDYAALVEIDADPRTKALLDLLPEAQSRETEIHLNGARIWRSGRNERARGKLEAASKALDELDLVLARGILRKIDAELLEPPELARYDELLLAVEGRTLELEAIEEDLPKLPPDKKSGKGGRFRKR